MKISMSLVVCVLWLLMPSWGGARQEPLWAGRPVSVQEDLCLGKESVDDEAQIFGSILSVAVSGKGEIFVVDGSPYRILRYDARGRFLSPVGSGQGDGPGEYRMPWAVALDAQDRIYVADQAACRIWLFEADGRFTGSVRTLQQPTTLVAGPSSRIYAGSLMGDPQGHEVLQYDRQGQVLARLARKEKRGAGGRGAVSGNYGRMALTPAGELVFARHYPCEIQVFSPEGKERRRFSRPGLDLQPPELDRKQGFVVSHGGCMGVSVLPDGTLVQLMVAHEGDRHSFWFDLFSPQGDWLLTLPERTFAGGDWLMHFTTGPDGAFYLVYGSPYPCIRRYRVTIGQAG